MTQSTVSLNFVACLKELKISGHIRSFREFCGELDFRPQNLSQIINGKRDATIDLIRLAHEKYNFNLNYIFTGQGEKIDKHREQAQNDGLSLSSLLYIDEHSEDDYLKSLNDKSASSFEFKSYRYNVSKSKKDARIFEMNSKELVPFIQLGDKLICKRIAQDRWERLIRDQFVYVLVNPQGINVCRLENHISQNGTLNIVRNVSFEISEESHLIDDILELWEITHIISRWSQDSNFEKYTLTDQLQQFQYLLDQNANSVKDLNNTMQKILKQNREQATVY